MPTVKQALSNSAKTLAEIEKLSNPTNEAGWLLGYVLKRDRAWLYAHPESLVSSSQQVRLNRLLIQRTKLRLPLAYLLGHQDFAGLNFIVTRSTLVPRPETEGLIELVAERILTLGLDHARLVDVGTGSGVIAISLKHRLPDLAVTATDISRRALTVARRNADRLQTKVSFVASDLLAQVSTDFEIIVANLPYGSEAGQSKWRPEVHHEPKKAILGGPDGLKLVRRLIQQISQRKIRPKLIALEIDAHQGQLVTQLAARVLPEYQVKTLADLAGHDRYVLLTVE